MVARTHGGQPRLALALHDIPIQAAATKTLGHASLAERPLAPHALVLLRAGLQDALAHLAGLGGLPAGRLPRADVVALEGGEAGALQLADEVAQEGRVPVVGMRGDEGVGLLEGEEVEDEGADGRGAADALVQDVRVAGRRHAVG